jgi:hypothetical protein
VQGKMIRNGSESSKFKLNVFGFNHSLGRLGFRFFGRDLCFWAGFLESEYMLFH